MATLDSSGREIAEWLTICYGKMLTNKARKLIVKVLQRNPLEGHLSLRNWARDTVTRAIKLISRPENTYYLAILEFGIIINIPPSIVEYLLDKDKGDISPLWPMSLKVQRWLELSAIKIWNSHGKYSLWKFEWNKPNKKAQFVLMEGNNPQNRSPICKKLPIFTWMMDPTPILRSQGKYDQPIFDDRPLFLQHLIFIL